MTTALGHTVAVVGAGPAGLKAAEVLSSAGVPVHLYDAMPSVGRKFLLAGIGGLNLTHAEPLDRFVTRYGARNTEVGRWLALLGPQGVRDWAHGLGIDTFVGSSNRVFPTDMKAAPLLRAWLHRLRQPTAGGAPVLFHMRHRWTGVLDTAPEGWRLETVGPQGPVEQTHQAVVLALGGASWPRLGSDGAWWGWLQDRGLALRPLHPANCGFDALSPRLQQVGWSAHLADRFAGHPLKATTLSFEDTSGRRFAQKGELVLTQTGLEGSLVYAASATLRDSLIEFGSATLHLDLKPDHSLAQVEASLAQPRGKKSLAAHLHGRLNLKPVHVALLRELLPDAAWADNQALAAGIKHLPITLHQPRPIAEAISTAGGVALESMTPDLMVSGLPGVFMAGEMLDWEAPTGGYLLTACLASGQVAGAGALKWWQAATHPSAAGP
ncbi:MAG: hypothetical protein RJA09_848 [Pseudomonadota bacterium]